MKLFYTILILYFFSNPLFAQQEHQEQKEKIRALKIAFITDKLDLTAAEAEKFWPIYNRFDATEQTIRQKMHDKRRTVKESTSFTEQEARIIITQIEQLEQERFQNRNQFIKDLQPVLSAKKTLLLLETEERFKRKMLEEFRKRGRKPMFKNRP